MAIFALAALAVGALSGNKARKEGKKAARTSNEATRLRNLRNRQQFLKEFRQARARALVEQVATGTSIESSGFQGVKSSINSQAVGTEDFIATQEALGAEVAKRQENANKFSNIAALAGTAANLGRAAAPLIGNRESEEQNPNVNSSPFSR